MSFDALKGLPQKELTARLNELSQESFKAKFTTEEMTPQRGAEQRRRRREIARIRTVMQGRQTLAGALSQENELNSRLEELGAPHTGDAKVKRRRSKLLNRLNKVKRTIRELKQLEGKAK